MQKDIVDHKIGFYAITFFFAFYCLISPSTADERFWNDRSNRLASDRASFTNMKSNTEIISLIDSEIARTAKMSRSAVLQQSTNGDTVRTYTDNDCINQAESLAKNTVQVAELYRMVKTVPARGTQTNESLVNLFKAPFSRLSIFPDNKTIEPLIRECVDSVDCEILAYEWHINKIKNAHDTYINSAKKTTADSIIQQLTATGYTLTASRFQEISFIAADNWYKNNYKNILQPDTLPNSPLTTYFKSIADNYVNNIEKLRSYLGNNSDTTDAALLLSLLKNPKPVEKTYFASLFVKLCDTTPFPASTSVIPAIPDDPDMQKLFFAIDKIRSDAVSNSIKTGFSSPQSADDKMKSLINTTIKNAADVFFREGERSQIVSGETSQSEPSIDNKSFNNARLLLKEKVKKANEYRTESVNFIAFINSLQHKNSVNIQYGARINALRSICSFASELDSISKNSSPTNNSRIIHSTLIHDCKNLYDRMSALSGLTAQFRKDMEKDEIASALSTRKDFIAECTAYISQLRANRTYISSQAPKVESVAAFSQDDYNEIAESIRAHAKTLSTLTRTDQMFSQYAVAYNQISNHLDNNNDALQAIQTGSIIPFVPTFDATMIESENTQRQYLRKKITADLAILQTILSTRKNTKPEVSDTISRDEIKSIRTLLEYSPSVKIISWIMTPGTIKKTDSALIQHLAVKEKTRSWNYTQTSFVEKIISLPNGSFSVSVPADFNTTGESPSSSLLLTASDSSGERIIQIALIPLSGIPLRDAVRDWLISNNIKVLSFAQENNEGKTFTLITGVDSRGNTVEARSFSRNGYGAVSIGIAPSASYNFFRPLLVRVAASMK